MSRAVDCFAVCGLSASPVTVSGDARGFVGAEERYLPEVLSSYPSTSSAGNNEDVGSVLAQLALMCMPEGVDVHIRDPPKEALAPRMYPLVLTEPDGALVHVMCLSFLEPVSDAARAAHPALRSACARKCLCLVSRARTPMSVLRAILRAVHRTCFVRARCDAPPLADVVAALVDGVPFPERGAPPALVTVFGRPMVVPAADDDDDATDDEGVVASEDGEVEAIHPPGHPSPSSPTLTAASFGNATREDDDASAPPKTSGPAWDASATDSGFELLVRALDERNAVRAACAVAEERRVLLRSRNDALLVSASMALLRTLRPMRWRHAFVPLLPSALAAATLARPGPFVVGVKADFVVPEAALENAVVVDLDANDVRGVGDAARIRYGSAGDGGFPRAFAEPLLTDLRRLASREPRDHGDGAENERAENETDTALPEWARVTAHAAAARAAARGRRWSAHHDDAVGESFRAFWRRCFRGYRSFLRAEPAAFPKGAASPGGKSEKSEKATFDAGIFDAAGFYRAQVASKDRGTREAAPFVRLVAASAAFEAHAGSQIRAAKRRDEKEKRRRATLFGGVADDAADRGGEAAARPPWTSPSPDDGALFDALLDEDSDERLALGQAGRARGNERKVRGGGFFGTSVAAAAEPEYLRAGAIVRAGNARLLSARADAGHPKRRVVSVTFRTVQSSGESEAASPSPRASFAAADNGFTSAASAAGPAAHALALSGEIVGFAPRAPAYPRARVPPIDPPTANADPAGTQGAPGGSRGPADPRGVAGSPVTLEGLGFALDARNLDLLERRKSRVRHESPASRRGSRSPEHRADSARERSPSPRRSPPFRRNSVDALAPGVFSHPGSAAGSPAAGGAAGERRLGDDSDEERDALEPGDDAAGLSPEKRNPRPSGSGKHLGLSFSIFGTRRSRRRSEANPLQKMEQAKQEVCARGESAHAGLAFARDRAARGAERGLSAGTRRAQARGRARGFGFGVRRVARRRRRRRAAPGQKGKDVRERPRRPCIQRGLERGRALGTARASRTRQVEFAVSVAAGAGRTGGVLAAAGDTRRGVPRARGRGCRAHPRVPSAGVVGARLGGRFDVHARSRRGGDPRRAVVGRAEGRRSAAAVAAELAATDRSASLALEGGGATERTAPPRPPPCSGGHRAMSSRRNTASPCRPPRQRRRRSRHHWRHLRRAERRMKAAEVAGRAASAAADEAAARGARRRGVGHRSDSRRTRRRARRPPSRRRASTPAVAPRAGVARRLRRPSRAPGGRGPGGGGGVPRSGGGRR